MEEKKKHRYSENEAYIKLSALCAISEHCLYDMKKKMRNWEFNADPEQRSTIIENILNRLVKERFIDEKRFTHAFVRDKFRYNKWGKTRIIQELKTRHIDELLIEDALLEIDDEDNLDTLRDIIKKKRPSVKGKSEYEIRCKLIRFALGRGFDIESINEVLDE